MVVGHFAKFVFWSLEALSEVIAETEHLDQILEQQLEQDFFFLRDQPFTAHPLEYLHPLP